LTFIHVDDPARSVEKPAPVSHARVQQKPALDSFNMMKVNGDILSVPIAYRRYFVSFLFLGSGLGDVSSLAIRCFVQIFVDRPLRFLDGFAFAPRPWRGVPMGGKQRDISCRCGVRCDQRLGPAAAR